MRKRLGARSVGAAIAVSAVGLTTSACWPAPQGCTSAFYDLIAQAHGSVSPELAIKAWLKTTSTPGIQLPLTGWHAQQAANVDAASQAVIMRSGRTTATATRLPDRSWMVTTYTQCK